MIGRSPANRQPHLAFMCFHFSKFLCFSFFEQKILSFPISEFSYCFKISANYHPLRLAFTFFFINLWGTLKSISIFYVHLYTLFYHGMQIHTFPNFDNTSNFVMKKKSLVGSITNVGRLAQKHTKSL